MSSAYYIGSYYIWIAIEFTFGIIYSFILNWKINQVYPWLKSDVKSGKLLYRKYPEVMKYTKQLFVHKITTIVQYQTTPFLIYAFVYLQTVAFYGNYTIITDKIKLLFDNFLGSTSASIGNLIAEGNKEKILKVYWEMMSLRFLIAGIASFSLYYLLPLFIELWLGKDYLLSNNVLIIALVIFSLGIIRGTTDHFIYGYGLFYDIFAPAIEALIFIIIALIGGSIWQLEGILLGSIISMLIVIYGWKPYFLFKKGFQISIWEYWYKFLKLVAITTTSLLLFKYLNTIYIWNIVDSYWGNFILYSLYTVLTLTFLQFTLLYLGFKSMRTLTRRFIQKL